MRRLVLLGIAVAVTTVLLGLALTGSSDSKDAVKKELRKRIEEERRNPSPAQTALRIDCFGAGGLPMQCF